MKKIKVALAGFGPGGRIYNAPIIASVEELQITTILTSSPENIQAAKSDFPEAAVVQDYDKVLNNEEIDLVVISTPNHLHKEFTEKALRAGKHVVIEKPYTPTVEEAEYLIRLSEKENRLLTVNHNRRSDSDIRTIKKLLDQGRLGDILSYEAHFDRFRPEIKQGWKEKKENPGNGMLYDLGSHLIDQALWLFGTPEAVFADLRAQRENSEVTDCFELLLYYPGLKVTLKAGMLVRETGPRYQIIGRNGSYYKWGMDVQEEDLKKGLRPNQKNDWGTEPRETWGNLITSDGTEAIESERGDYRNLYQNVAASISGKEKLQVTPQQACRVILIIELAIKSNKEKRIIPVGPLEEVY